MVQKKRSDYVVIPRDVLEDLYYGQGLTAPQIAERFGVSARTILNRMREYGMERRTIGDYLRVDISEDEIYRLYVEEKMPAPAIAKALDIGVTFIYRRMKQFGIDTRADGWDKIKRIIPPEKLEWSPNFAYAVGLITSDGNLRRDMNEVKFYSTDRELTDHYCRALGLRPDYKSVEEWGNDTDVLVHAYQDTRQKQYKDQYHIVFSDYVYRARLEEIGLTPDKSKTLGPLAIPDEYFRDFLRGVFDGDGCWHVARGQHLIGVITSGSPHFRHWLLETIWKLTPINNGVDRGIEVRFNGYGAVRLGDFMYYQSDLLALSRKRYIWENCAQNHYR